MNTRRNKLRSLTDAPERRAIPYDRVELREDDEDSNIIHFEGYASTFQEYEMYGGPAAGGWIERIAMPAFDKTLREKPDLHFLINHAGMPIARTKSGTMQLSVDDHGLKVVAQLDKRDPDVQGLAVKMERGDMDEMSFAFRVKEQRWQATDEFKDDDMALRTITEVSLHKGDVSVVNWGANPTTSAGLRSAADAVRYLAECDESELAEVRSELSGEWLKRVAGVVTGGPPGIENLHQGILTPNEAREAMSQAGQEAGEQLGEALGEAPEGIEAREGEFVTLDTFGDVIISQRIEGADKPFAFHTSTADMRKDSDGFEIILSKGDLDQFRKAFDEFESRHESEAEPEVRGEDTSPKPKVGMSLRMALALLEED